MPGATPATSACPGTTVDTAQARDGAATIQEIFEVGRFTHVADGRHGGAQKVQFPHRLCPRARQRHETSEWEEEGCSPVAPVAQPELHPLLRAPHQKGNGYAEKILKASKSAVWLGFQPFRASSTSCIGCTVSTPAPPRCIEQPGLAEATTSGVARLIDPSLRSRI